MLFQQPTRVSGHPTHLRRGQHWFMRLGAMAALGVLLLLTACGGSTTGNTSTPTTAPGTTPTPTPVPCPQTTTLTGGGSTFVNPLFSKMFQQYAQIGCMVQVNYQATGSGAGIAALQKNLLDFGATDGPMTDAQIAQAAGGPVIHIPVTVGPVAISYNLPGVTGLNLTGPVIAAIYLGKITKWNDPQITALNSGVTLPDATITVVHRSDGSGTTSIFTHYLAAVSPDWAKVGAGTTINWPIGVGASGNAGVATQVKNTTNAIGYNELAYLILNNIPFANIQNAAGKFITPSLDSVKAALSNASALPDDLRVYIVNEPGDQSYPITGFSWILVYQNQTNADKGQAVANMIWWVIHDGQQYATPLNYTPLPANIVSLDEAKIKLMMCGSSPCYKG